MSDDFPAANAEFGVGIDPGTENWRVALTSGHEPVPVEVCTPSPVESQPGCDLGRKSWKVGLGTSDSGAMEDATRRFREIVQSLGRIPNQVHVCVPSWFTSRHRTVFRTCAAAAGLQHVTLVSDGIAATASAFRSGLSALVVCVGHHGCETSFIRCLDRRLEVATTRWQNKISGKALGELVIKSMFTGIDLEREHHLLSGWPKTIAASASKLNELLATRNEVLVEVREPSHPPLQLTMRRRDRDFFVQRIIDDLLDEVDAVLADPGVGSMIPDVVLLFGKPMSELGLRERFESRFEGRVHRLHDWAAAYGAARLALGETLPPPTADSAIAPAEQVDSSRVASAHGDGEVVVEGDRVVVTLGISPSVPVQVQGGQGDSDIDQVTVEPESVPTIGRSPAATPTLPPPSSPISETSHATPSPVQRAENADQSVSAALARHSLKKSRKLLAAGESENAVRESHRAFADIRAHGDTSEESQAEILEAMLDVHIDAALAANTPETYEDALRWLNCANGHCPSNNPRVYRALADRNALHARQMLAANRYKEAAIAATDALRYHPESDEIALLVEQAEDGIQRP